MLWYCALLIFASSQSAIAVQAAGVSDNTNLNETCKEYSIDKGQFDYTTDLGVWYEVSNQTTNVNICVDFHLLTDQYRETLKNNLSDYLNNDTHKFDKYSLYITQICPGVTTEDKGREIHVWEKLNEIEHKSVFQGSAIWNNTVRWNNYKVMVGKFIFMDKEYFGVMEKKRPQLNIFSRKQGIVFEENLYNNLYNCFKKIYHW